MQQEIITHEDIHARLDALILKDNPEHGARIIEILCRLAEIDDTVVTLFGERRALSAEYVGLQKKGKEETDD